MSPCVRIDVKYLPQMADEDRRPYLFVAIDRATRWVFVRVYPAKVGRHVRRFLRDLNRAAPMRITRIQRVPAFWDLSPGYGRSRIGKTLSQGQVAEGMGRISNLLHLGPVIAG